MIETAPLVEAFEERTLPKKDWTHEAHLTVAFHYLKMYNVHEAICLMRANIIAYNVSVGGVNSFSGGYHETLTLFWIKIIRDYIQHNPSGMLADFLSSPSADKNLPLVYFSKAYLSTVKARSVWVTPDIKPLVLDF